MESSRLSVELFVLIVCFDDKDKNVHALMLNIPQCDFCNLDVLQMMHQCSKQEFYYRLRLLQVADEQFLSSN